MEILYCPCLFNLSDKKLGHMHMPMCVQINKTLVVNPGAICGNRKQEATCAILTLPDLVFQLYSVETGLVVNINP